MVRVSLRHRSTMPLTQHTLPIINTKSYISWPHWDYRRVKGLGKVQLNDIVVFNFPAGDTIMSEPAYQGNDTIMMSIRWVRISLHNRTLISICQHEYTPNSVAFFDKAYATGRAYIVRNAGTFGTLDWRPTDVVRTM